MTEVKLARLDEVVGPDGINVDTDLIENAAVTTVKLADDAVTNAKLADEAIEAAQITADADKLAAIRDKIFTIYVRSALSDLKARGTTTDATRYLSMDGKSGMFRVVEGDFTDQLTADTKEGIFLKMTGVDESTAALQRVLHSDIVHASWFEAKGDNSTDNVDSYNCANAVMAYLGQDSGNIGGGELRFGAGRFLFTTRPDALTLGVHLKGAGRENTYLEQTYAEATATNSFITWGSTNSGGRVEDMTIRNAAGGGTALGWIAGSNVATGPMLCRSVIITTTGDGVTDGWDYGVYLDGSLSTTTPGVRQSNFNFVHIFGCTTASMRLKAVDHLFIDSACEMIPAGATDGVSKIIVDAGDNSTPAPTDSVTIEPSYCRELVVGVTASASISRLRFNCQNLDTLTLGAVSLSDIVIEGQRISSLTIPSNGNYSNVTIRGPIPYSTKAFVKGIIYDDPSDPGNTLWSSSKNAIVHFGGGIHGQGITLADGKSVTLTFQTAPYIYEFFCGVSSSSGKGARVRGSRGGTTVTIEGDTDTFLTATGTGVVITKTSASSAFTIKNSTGASVSLYIQATAGTPSSITDPA